MKKAMKKMIMAGALCVAGAALIAGCGDSGSSAGGGKQFLNIATGGTAGTYYPLGGALAELLNQNIKGMNASAQSTGASVANVNMLKDGSVDIAFIQNDIAYYAANGKEMFKDNKVENIRGIAALYPETVQFVTTADKGIKSIADLKGKKVAVGASGSGAEANARQILGAYGLTYEHVDKLKKQYPYFTEIIVPKGTYPGQEEDVSTVAVKCVIVTTDKLSDDLGEQIVKAIYEHLDRMKAAHAVGKYITKDTALEGMSIKMNAGAEKYLKAK